MKMKRKLALAALLAVTPLSTTVLSIDTVEAADQYRWDLNEAPIQPNLYVKLIEQAEFGAYVHTKSPIDLQRAKHLFDSSNGIIEETSTYIYGYDYKYNNLLLVTKDGLILNAYSLKKEGIYPVSYYEPLDVALTEFVKRLTGPTLENFNYIQFQQLQSTKTAFVSLGYGYGGKLTVPSDAVIQKIKVYGHYEEEDLMPASLTPGQTHVIDNQVRIDGIKVTNNSGYYDMEISYTGSGNFSSDDHTVHSYDLTNRFQPAFIDVQKGKHWAYDDVLWAVRKGIVQGHLDGRFKPADSLKEGDFTVILSRYFNLKPASYEGDQKIHRTQPYYDLLKRYDLPLNGYNQDTPKAATVTRGQLAQVFAASQGKASDLKSAVQFMYDNNLSSGVTGKKTFDDYQVNTKLTRAQISSFFKNMETKGFTTLK